MNSSPDNYQSCMLMEEKPLPKIIKIVYPMVVMVVQ